MTLGKSELRLIFELDSNYRQSYSKIGRRLHMSQQLVSYRVGVLEKTGIIQGLMPLVDYSRLGLFSFIVYCKVSNLKEEALARMFTHLGEHENITSVSECDGKYDVELTFLVRNPSSFNKKLRLLLSRPPQQLRNPMILTTVVEHHFLRSYLARKEHIRDEIVGGDREKATVDDIDLGILHMLIAGKKSLLDIAAAVHVSPKTSAMRLRRLESESIIRGYRLRVDVRPMGMSRDSILIKFRDIFLERQEEFHAFCMQNPNIVEFTRTFGEWDARIVVESRNRAEFRSVYTQMRQRFEDIIDDYDTFRIFKVHKRQFLPDELFKEKQQARKQQRGTSKEMGSARHNL